MSLRVYYDSDLSGLTDSLWGREAVKENERGKADSTKDAPSPQPELRPTHRGLLSTSRLGRNRWVKVVTLLSPRPRQNVKLSSLPEAWACVLSACHVHAFRNLLSHMFHRAIQTSLTQLLHGVQGTDITSWAKTGSVNGGLWGYMPVSAAKKNAYEPHQIKKMEMEHGEESRTVKRIYILSFILC